MANTTVGAQIHQPLNANRGLAPQITFNLMIAQGGGSIIHTSSGWGILGGDKAAAYCAAKAAVRGFTETLSIELKGTHIGVSSGSTGSSAFHSPR